MSIRSSRRRETLTIHASWVAPAGHYMTRYGHSPQPLYAHYGWAAAEVEAGTIRVPLGEFFSFLDAAAEQIHDPFFGLHIWEHFDFADLGVLGFALLSASDVESALATLLRYGAVFQDGAAGELIVEGNRARLLYRASPCGLPLSRHDCDMSIAFYVFLLRRAIARPWSPLAVQLQHDGVPDQQLGEYKRVFGCCPTFGCATNQVIFDRDVLAQPIHFSDKRMHVIFERNLMQLQRQSRADGELADQVATAILPKLSNGTPTLAAVARTLRLTPRALQRRLAAEKLRFSELLDKARFRLAIRLLATTNYTLTDITYLAGFSEASAFIRGFRRFTGCTPLEYRRSVREFPSQDSAHGLVGTEPNLRQSGS
jgi:AraC-like DNA-binding protein